MAKLVSYLILQEARGSMMKGMFLRVVSRKRFNAA
jgi:hypothetical protein